MKMKNAINVKYCEPLCCNWSTDENGMVYVFEHKYSVAYNNVEYRVFWYFDSKKIIIQKFENDYCDIIDLYEINDIELEYMFDITVQYIKMYENTHERCEMK